MDEAIRVVRALGSTTEPSLGLPMVYDLWKVRRRLDNINVERVMVAT